MGEGQYTLNELTKAAGVSTRTVRYYISEGLLPPPATPGPRATYSDVHLNRLRLIGQLKDSYLPLKEIRRSLDTLSDEEIAAMTDRQGGPDLDIPFAASAAEDAALYLQNALTTSPIRRLHPLTRQSRATHMELKDLTTPPGDETSTTGEPSSSHARIDRFQAPPRSTQLHDVEGSAWRRITLGPDAELLVREDAFERKRDRIEWLINWAKRVFN